MKRLWAGLPLLVALWAHSQTAPEPPRSPLSVADFGLVYPLSNDWVRATQLIRARVESANPPPNFDVVLAAVYVPKSSMSNSNPFFSVRAYRQSVTSCQKSMEALITNAQDRKDRAGGGVEEFSSAGRDYFRVNTPHGTNGLHQSVICTVANGHLLVWSASAPDDKRLDLIVGTLDSITSLPERKATGSSSQSTGSKDGAAATPSKPVVALPEKVRVSSGVTGGLLIKKVNPPYPADARAAHIQGTVILQAEISKTGDITDLELVEGPIELAGSAVAAVRQWKYKPYLLKGEPVIVSTQVQVNYQLSR